MSCRNLYLRQTYITEIQSSLFVKYYISWCVDCMIKTESNMATYRYYKCVFDDYKMCHIMQQACGRPPATASILYIAPVILSKFGLRKAKDD